MMETIEWITYLIAVIFYILSSILYIYYIVFNKDDKIKYAFGSALVGLLSHSISITLRWIETGQGPFVSTFEVFSQYAWVSVAIFLVMQKKYDEIKIAGFIIMPVSFLLMGMGSSYSKEFQTSPPSLQTFWLMPHAVFASLAFGAILVATGMAILYILKEHFDNSKKDTHGPNLLYNKLPSLKAMDELMYRFVASGFISLSVMIISGAIWAYQSWGRYWAWDPIESWSLIAWLVYGIYLHQRMNAGWKGTRVAWLLVVGIFILVFTLFGAGYIYSGLHSSYMTP
ncbi:MAG: c-type cytochrome biogenesis protein CcsB [Methanosarcinaceae archaeon]|nr:c-type cytochrome biogenesis protein CcsB [Methanosarcinaceae archaeon]